MFHSFYFYVPKYKHFTRYRIKQCDELRKGWKDICLLYIYVFIYVFYFFLVFMNWGSGCKNCVSYKMFVPIYVRWIFSIRGWRTAGAGSQSEILGWDKISLNVPNVRNRHFCLPLFSGMVQSWSLTRKWLQDSCLLWENWHLPCYVC